MKLSGCRSGGFWLEEARAGVATGVDVLLTHTVATITLVRLISVLTTFEGF